MIQLKWPMHAVLTNTTGSSFLSRLNMWRLRPSTLHRCQHTCTFVNNGFESRVNDGSQKCHWGLVHKGMFCHSSLMTETELVVDKCSVEVSRREQITPIVKVSQTKRSKECLSYFHLAGLHNWNLCMWMMTWNDILIFVLLCFYMEENVNVSTQQTSDLYFNLSLCRGRQGANDIQPWDISTHGQHTEWHGGLGEEHPQGDMGSVWRRWASATSLSE